MTNPSDAISTPNPASVVADPALPLAKRPSWKVLALALAVASVSDLLSFGVALVPPLQWTIDIVTALALFLFLGRRLAILPGLIAEAIPGMGVFPVWILVVLSIILYDDIKGRKH